MTARRQARRPDRLLGTAALDTPGEMTMLHLIAPADRLAREMETKWGRDRLPELVTPDLAMRFGSQREKFERAVATRDMDALAIETPRMCNAWRALDAAAETAGHTLHPATVWEFDIDGRPAAIVRSDDAGATAWAAEHPGTRVWTLDEITRVLGAEYLRLVNTTKDLFPGATVTAVKASRSDLAEQLDDEIPF